MSIFGIFGRPFSAWPSTGLVFEHPVRARVVDLRSASINLRAEEAWDLVGASPARWREYAVGRSLARGLLKESGLDQCILRRGPDGEPMWPPGFCGSITHTRKTCGVAIARAEWVHGVGLDIETATPLDEALWCDVTTSRELEWLQTRNPLDRGLLATLLFSAKECLFKCQFYATRHRLSFQDVEIWLDLESLAFKPRFPRWKSIASTQLERQRGRFTLHADEFFVAMVWRRGMVAAASPRKDPNCET